MLSHLSHNIALEAPTVTVVLKLLRETIVDRDIGVEEVCHMLQKPPLLLYSSTFISFPLTCILAFVHMMAIKNSTNVQ